jgi:hypothetical protein
MKSFFWQAFRTLALRVLAVKEGREKGSVNASLGEIACSDNIDVGWTDACGSSAPRQRNSFGGAIRSLRRRDALDRFV